jgi:hypothetical protein
MHYFGLNIEKTWALMWTPERAWALILIAVFIDLLNLILSVNRKIKGHGSSGIYGVQWVFSGIAVLFSYQPIPFQGNPSYLFRILNILVLATWHILIFYIIMSIDKRRKQDRHL